MYRAGTLRFVVTLAIVLVMVVVSSATPASAQAGRQDGRGRVRVGGQRLQSPQVGLVPGLRGEYDRLPIRLDIGLPPIAERERLLPRTAADRTPLQVGVHRRVPDAFAGPLDLDQLDWTATDDGGVVAAFTVTSPGASALRIAIQGVAVPRGTQIRFFSAWGDETVFGPYGPSDLRAQRDRGAVDVKRGERALRRTESEQVFWSPVIDGDRAGVELYLPSANRIARLVLELRDVSHLFYSPLRAESRQLSDVGSAGACENDVACESLGQYVDSVAKIIFSDSGGTFLCTGQLLNDTDTASRLPYFSTANHCVSRQSAAESIDFFWFFERAQCGGADPTSVTQTSGGADLLRTSDVDSGTDLTLMVLSNAPPGGTYLSAWDSRQAAGSIVGVHHPAGDLKKASLGDIVGTEPWQNQGFDSHYRVQWSRGVTEGGSSGSGLWSNGDFIGVLTGGSSACGSPTEPDLYGRFDLAFDVLSPWLDAGSLPRLAANSTVSGTVGADEWSYFRLTIPSSSAELELILETSRGDADLYVKAPFAPTLDVSDCLSRNGGLEDDTCAASGAGQTVVVGVFGFADSDFRLTAGSGASDPVPGQPVVVSPSGTVDDETPAYQWNAASGAESYRLRVVGSGGTVIDTTVGASAACSGDSCSTTPATTLADGDFSWTVQASNATGDGPASASLAFAVSTATDPDPTPDPVPGQPVAVSPSGTVDDETPAYQWNAASGAESYLLRVVGSGGTVIDTTVGASAACSGDSCSTTPATTLADGDFSWTVQASNATGDGPASASLAFAVSTATDPDPTPDPVPGQPVAVSPSGTVDDETPAYQWNAASGAESYLLRVVGSGGTVIDTTVGASAACSGDSCSTTPATTLADGDFSWTVQASNATGDGPASASLAFAVSTATDPDPTPDPVPGQPVAVSPSGTVDDETPAYQWNAASGAESYLLRVVGSGGTVIDTTVGASAACSGDSCSTTPATTLADGDFSWTVQASNATGDGPANASLAFAVSTATDPDPTPDPVPTTPNAISPSGRISTSSPTYVFAAAAGAAHYDVKIVSARGVVHEQRYAASALCVDQRCSLTTPPAPVLGSGFHRWAVRASNDAGASEWRVRGFDVFIQLQQPQLLSPGGTIRSRQPVYRWTAVEGATSYQLQVSQRFVGRLHRRWYRAADVCSAGVCEVRSPPVPTLQRGRFGWWVRPKAGTQGGPRSARKVFRVR